MSYNKTIVPLEHVECISDFCGNYKSPGAWADLYECKDGSQVIMLGGGWVFYGKNTPEFIHDTSEHFKPFLEACENNSDFAYVKEHFDN